ncbi:MAG: hypothetical protein ACOX8R_05165 [Bacillota bacterium]|jgi:hypothetical protein
MNEMKQNNAKLRLWQERLAENDGAYAAFSDRFDRREELFRGSREVSGCADGDKDRVAKHVRNIVAELIEAQVDANIPAPKVTPRRAKDEALAKIIEDMLRNELDRLPFETLNDMMERTVPIQGGAYFLLEWDNTLGGHDTAGELTVAALHPKQVVPENGVYTAVEDMDYIILKLPQTKAAIRRRYGVSVADSAEAEPGVRSGGGESEAKDMVTQYVAYFRNDGGGIGRFSWVNDTVLEDYEDYQARRLRRCESCGAAEPAVFPPAPREHEDDGEREAARADVCPRCGGRFVERGEDFEEVWLPRVSTHGVVIPGARWEEAAPAAKEGEDSTEHEVKPVLVPTRIPYYKPDLFPVILQKSVSVFGQLLGDSDVDKISDQQNTSNRVAAKILDKLLKAGSFATLPADAMLRTDNEEMKYIRLENAADKSMIDVYDMEGTIEQDLTVYRQVYEEARDIIGITDSFQGRRDTTATSGKAKEFAASQAAGRLESKRVMKNAAYAKLFEAMFKFRLAYADEPRAVTSRNVNGDVRYDAFDRYDFLERDESGEWYWNDAFLFSCDTSASLAANREQMWQETRLNLQQGAFGDPADVDTLILFWDKMARLHYPCAEETKRYLQEQKEKKERAAAENSLRPGQMAAAAPLFDDTASTMEKGR